MGILCLLFFGQRFSTALNAGHSPPTLLLPATSAFDDASQPSLEATPFIECLMLW